MPETPQEWTDADSRQFLDLADLITPSRAEQMEMLAALVPARADEPFQVVELGCGGGDLAARLLERFPRARYLGLDGSAAMLETAAERLKPHAGRVELRPFRLEADDWLAGIGAPVRCICSSLVVHHLDDAGKRSLYQALWQHLEPGGALLLIDIVLPEQPHARAAAGAAWDEAVRAQSLARTGSDAVYRRFKADGWNCYTHPDPMDRPASLFAQLKWLEAAGFRSVDCFWQRAGHALFGGFR